MIIVQLYPSVFPICTDTTHALQTHNLLCIVNNFTISFTLTNNCSDILIDPSMLVPAAQFLTHMNMVQFEMMLCFTFTFPDVSAMNKPFISDDMNDMM